MNVLRNILRSWMNLSRGERNGTLILTIILLLLLVFTILIPHIQQPWTADAKALIREAEQLANRKVDSLQLPVENSREPEFFDPNSATHDELLRVGMSEKNINTLLNFRQKGGVFRKPADLKKIYGLNEDSYSRLAPLVVIKDISWKSSVNEADSSIPITKPNLWPVAKTNEPRICELNSSDSSELVILPGIGPVMAARIIRFREKLGGFCALHQLKEVYGMKEEYYSLAVPHLTLDTTLLRKIDLNQVKSLADLKHPYLSPWQATAILKYTSMGRKIISSRELVKYQVLKEEDYQHIRPYFLP